MPDLSTPLLDSVNSKLADPSMNCAGGPPRTPSPTSSPTIAPTSSPTSSPTAGPSASPTKAVSIDGMNHPLLLFLVYMV